MKITFENSYWPNAFGVVGIAFAFAICMRGCSNVMIEQEKTRQIEIKYEKSKVDNTK